jgi:hypothetical protein
MAKAKKRQPTTQPPESRLSDLEAQFPERNISLSEDRVVKMKPIPLRALPTFLKPFMKLVQLAESGSTIGDMIEAAGDDVMQMIDVCLVDASIDDFDLSDAPPLIDALLDMNVSKDVLGKWGSLLQKIILMLPNGEDRLQEAASKTRLRD